MPRPKGSKNKPKTKVAAVVEPVVTKRRVYYKSCAICGNRTQAAKNADPDTVICKECTSHVPRDKELLKATCPYDQSKLRIVEIIYHPWGDMVWFQCDECGKLIEVCSNTSKMRWEFKNRPDSHVNPTMYKSLVDAKYDMTWAPKNPTTLKKPRKRKTKEA